MNGEHPVASLRLNACWSFAGQGLYLACQWLLLAFIARHGGAAATGAYALALAVTAPVMIFANLQLRELQATDASGEFAFHERLALRLCGCVAALLVVGGICWACAWPAATCATMLTMTAAKCVESLAELGYGACQSRGRFRAIAFAQALRGVAGLAGGAGVYLASGDLPLALAAMAVCWMLCVTLVDLPRLRAMPGIGTLPPFTTAARMRALLAQALPMGAVACLASLMMTIPSYLVEQRLGAAALGKYAALNYLLLAGNVVMSALGFAAGPRLAQLSSAGERASFLALLSRMLLTILALALLAAGGALLLGESILAIAYGQEWRGEAPLLAWLAIAAGTQWLASVLGVAATAARRLRVQLPIFAAACATSAIAGTVLIPRFGLVGAAWSGAATGLVLIACYALLFLPRTAP